MTEEEWHQSTATHQLLMTCESVATSQRKLKLLACAVARTVLSLAKHPRAEELLATADLCADDPRCDALRADTRRDMQGWYRDVLPKSSRFALSAIYWSLGNGTRRECEEVMEVAGRATGGDGTCLVTQSALLRCIVGNPFRPVAFDPRWRSETAVALAAERAFDRLPILADALEEAGCDHPDVLAHCRDPHQPHARGCWVVDLVLGKS